MIGSQLSHFLVITVRSERGNKKQPGEKEACFLQRDRKRQKDRVMDALRTGVLLFLLLEPVSARGKLQKYITAVL